MDQHAWTYDHQQLSFDVAPKVWSIQCC